MNMFFKVIVCLMLTAGQSLYIGASANSNTAREIAALPPSAASSRMSGMTTDTDTVKVNCHVIPGVTVYGDNLGADEAYQLAKAGVLIGTDTTSGYIDLENGNILLNPEKNIAIGIGKGEKILIGSGASVFVSKSGNDVVVYNLLPTQSKQGQVSVVVDKHKLVVEPARMLVLTGQSTEDFEKLDMDCHSVTYRNAKAVDLGTGNDSVKMAFIADFSISSALATIQPLRRLTVSNNNHDKLALANLVKGAVICGDFAATIQPAVTIADVAPVQIANQ